jgi:2-keto-4-pentenoate hydratase/2-oxohepta-3-ene-1,7-dioic acid hydratase in catechol pathway
MRFVSFTTNHRSSYGVAVQGGVYDLGARVGAIAPDLKAYLTAVALGFSPRSRIGDADFAFGEFTYAPVIPNPQKILCVGLNYKEHRKETGRAEAAHPAIFMRFADTLIGHGASILLPNLSSALDYEGELAIVIGRSAFRIDESEALNHIAGYACFNDATLRDWQRHTHQFTPGKNFPGTGPLGPALVTPDEVGDFNSRRLETKLNGKVVQKATLGEMLFSPARIIAYVSAFTPLQPGDVIATGTPGGVGFKRNPQLFMRPGDEVEVVIEGIGALKNLVAVEPGAAGTALA